MNSRIWILALAAAVVVTFACQEPLPTDIEVSPLFGLAKGATKVTICHKGRTITVGAPAVAAHLAHGDVSGECEAPDDGGDQPDDEGEGTGP